MMPTVFHHRLGKLGFREAWDLQTKVHQATVARKLAMRNGEAQGQWHNLLFVEHPPVFTLGKSGAAAHLLLDEEQLAARGFAFYKVNRGGDITYHGPGQLVAYPIFDLDEFFNDVHRYVRSLEEVVIRTLSDFGLEGMRDAGFTGVWLAGQPTRKRPTRKICAIGVHLSRWTTLHGLALNVRPNLSHFANIIPCGIADVDRSVTSMSVELGRQLEVEEVIPVMESHFAAVFEYLPTKAPAGSILLP